MTSRATTEAQAASGALKHCFQPPVASLDDNSIRARACRRSFGAARDLLLSRRDANFASRWDEPAASTTAPVGRFTKAYPLRPDVIRVREVEGLTGDDWEVKSDIVRDGTGAEIETKVLLTDAETVKVRVTRRVENVALWDAEFLVAFEFLLASFMPELTRDAGLTDRHRQAAEDYFDLQSKSDARESAPQQRSRSTSWIRARSGQ